MRVGRYAPWLPAIFSFDAVCRDLLLAYTSRWLRWKRLISKQERCSDRATVSCACRAAGALVSLLAVYGLSQRALRSGNWAIFSVRPVDLVHFETAPFIACKLAVTHCPRVSQETSSHRLQDERRTIRSHRVWRFLLTPMIQPVLRW